VDISISSLNFATWHEEVEMHQIVESGAAEFLRDRDLPFKITQDLTTLGYVGEEDN